MCLGLLAAPWFGGCAATAPSAWRGVEIDEPAAAEIRDRTSPIGRTEWPYWPRRMRVHPLTQFATDRESGGLVLEVRLEFFDDEGHTTKAVGQVLVDLLGATRTGMGAEPLEMWTCDLTDTENNLEHFDDVTRTYLFRLTFDPKVLPQEPVLIAYFHSDDGEHLQSMAFELQR